MEKMAIPSLEYLQAAQARLLGRVHRTPVLSSSYLEAELGARLFFKCENFQKIGAFKFRGATNALLQVDQQALKNGACTHSSGNHAQAVALAARQLGVPAHIIMPRTAPQVKVDAVRGYGAHIYMCEPTQQAREAMAEEVMAQTGAVFVHPYDDPRIVAGQATACMELLEEQAELDFVLAPIGGGGLVGGTALAAKHFGKGCKVYACEPDLANDAYIGFQSGQRQPAFPPKTIADGLLTSVGELNFEILQQHVEGVITCSESAIIQAMRLIWERMKIVVEPSSAVPLACLLEGKLDVAGKRLGIILSGGNVDLSKLPW